MRKTLLFLLIVGCSAIISAQKKPYNNLIISEVRMTSPNYNYCEVTNMGTETIDLSEFKLSLVGTYTPAWTWEEQGSIVFPQVMLAPGESYIVASAFDVEPRLWAMDFHGAHSELSQKNYKPWVQPKEMEELTDYFIHMPENFTNVVVDNDNVSPRFRVMNIWEGTGTWALRHLYTIDGIPDSMIIDQVGGVFDGPNGLNFPRAYDVAGVTGATGNSILIRKASITTGISEFSSREANGEAAKMHFNNARGIDLADSEWIPVPYLTGGDAWRRAAFWTVGNQGDYKLDENTLVPKIPGEIMVDFAQATITVPWGMVYNDSIMNHFVRKPGIAWGYEYAPTRIDSMYTSIRTGDKLRLYVCGKTAQIKTFNFIVNEPTPSNNQVLSKTPKNQDDSYIRRLKLYEVTDGIAGMDTIRGIPFQARVDGFLLNLEKAPKSTWKIIPKSGIVKVELSYGDILQVTSENGAIKEYFLKIMGFQKSDNALLSSITWPDMPNFFKGDFAGLYGWKGDTIPGFVPTNSTYSVQVPLGVDGIPALVFAKQNPNSTVVVERAKTLTGSLEDATVTFTVTAQDGKKVKVYTVRFDQEKDFSNVQPYQAEPYFSQIVCNDRWYFPWFEIANPGTETIDLSHYLIARGGGDAANIFNMNNEPWKFASAYTKYVPGKKWQDEANWTIQPRILEQDLGTNSIVQPGDVFVMTAMDLAKDPGAQPGEVHMFEHEIDFNFWKTPWGDGMAEIGENHAIFFINNWAFNFCLFKILNDSVVDGLKPANDINDFELIDYVGPGQGGGTRWVLGGDHTVNTWTGMTRKPNIYKGNPIPNSSFGTNHDDCEWTWVDANMGIFDHILDGIGAQNMDPVTAGKSTVSSLIYMVSPGFSQKETIKGIGNGVTVADFYTNILKADTGQTLKVKSVANGAELNDASVISMGDSLIVISANSETTTSYILDLSPLSSDVTLTSTVYTIETTPTGLITGFDKSTLLRTVLDNVVVPDGATLTIIDDNGAYMSLLKLNYDTAYVDVLATIRIYFKVIAENGTNNIVYQLMPNSNSGDAYLTSDVYSVNQGVNQGISFISFVPWGTEASIFLSNVTPAPGATVAVHDQTGYLREAGNVYSDDRVVVTSADGTAKKVYFLDMLNDTVNTYFAFVTSDIYAIDQFTLTIDGPSLSTSLTEFYGKLDPSFGATLSVIDMDGNESNYDQLNAGDKLLVTAADKISTAIYEINFTTKIVEPGVSTFKIYPNPTADKVIIHGLSKGNRVRVFNLAGIALRDVIVDNSTEYVSLAAQPAGIYIFIISDGTKHLSIQKIVKN